MYIPDKVLYPKKKEENKNSDLASSLFNVAFGTTAPKQEVIPEPEAIPSKSNSRVSFQKDVAKARNFSKTVNLDELKKNHEDSSPISLPKPA